MQCYKILLLTCLLTFIPKIIHAETACFNLIKQLKNKTININFNGGIWGSFEKSLVLRVHSVIGIQLDSRINKLLFTINYICETKNGIPLNDLATYISRNLSVKSKSEFKSELISIGKTPQQIAIWFKFHQFSQENKSRKLKLSLIKEVIIKATPIIEMYVQIANNISRKNSPELILKNTKSLILFIDKFLAKQPYLAKALEENSYIPYWDINESTGGS